MAEGIKFGIVSGRGSAALARRAEELGLDFCQMNISDKAQAVAGIRAQYGVEVEETLFLGTIRTIVSFARNVVIYMP